MHREGKYNQHLNVLIRFILSVVMSCWMWKLANVDFTGQQLQCWLITLYSELLKQILAVVCCWLIGFLSACVCAQPKTLFFFLFLFFLNVEAALLSIAFICWRKCVLIILIFISNMIFLFFDSTRVALHNSQFKKMLLYLTQSPSFSPLPEKQGFWLFCL